jgi:hypothetical protein
MRLHPILAVLATAFLVAGTASATTVLHLSPQQVDDLAARIVEGRCVEIRPGPTTPELPSSTEFVFDVEQVLKGEIPPGQRLVVRQVGGPAAPQGSANVVGMPTYVVGTRYRLALNADSSLGLTSPVGMGQGVRVLPDVAATTREAAPASAPVPGTTVRP